MPAAASNSLLRSRASWNPRNSSVHGNRPRQLNSRPSTFSFAMRPLLVPFHSDRGPGAAPSGSLEVCVKGGIIWGGGGFAHHFVCEQNRDGVALDSGDQFGDVSQR